jgi:predicted dehydrogenase
MRILLIGFGSIGRRHHEQLSINPLVERIDVVTKHGNINERTYNDLYSIDFIELKEYSIFIICSETYLHESQLKYIDSNVENKMILVEKPLSNNELKFSPKNTIFISYNLRFHPLIQKLKSLLVDEDILSYSVRSGQYLPSWRPDQDYRNSYSSDLMRGGGVLRDLSHEIDYTMWLCGNIKLVSAISSSSSQLKIKSDDICTILATNFSGTHIQIQMDYLSFRPKREIEIQTNDYTISACMIRNTIQMYDKNGMCKTIKLAQIDRNYTYAAVHNELLHKETNILTSFSEANDTMKIIDLVTDNYMEKKWL